MSLDTCVIMAPGRPVLFFRHRPARAWAGRTSSVGDVVTERPTRGPPDGTPRTPKGCLCFRREAAHSMTQNAPGRRVRTVVVPAAAGAGQPGRTIPAPAGQPGAATAACPT